MQINFLVILAAAVAPLLVGFVWYHPKVFGTAWMKAADMSKEKAEGMNMGMVFGLSFVFNIMVAFTMSFIVIHQNHLYSILINEQGFNDPNSAIQTFIKDFMSKYGNNFRTFKHGALHGFFTGFFIALPVVGTNALFERKGAKYIAVNAGYWMVSMMLMGGIVCQFT